MPAFAGAGVQPSLSLKTKPFCTALCRIYLGLICSASTRMAPQAEAWTVAADSPRTEFKRFRHEYYTEATAYRAARDGMGHVYVTGLVNNVDNAGGKRLGGVFRLNEADGSADPTFRLGPTLQNTSALAVQPDGKVLATGNMGHIGADSAEMRLYRYLADGSPDPTFNPPVIASADPAVSPPRIIEVQADGRILLGGGFDHVGGFTRGRLVRLNKDGTVDDSFRPPNLADLNFANVAANILVDTNGGRLLAGGFVTDRTAPPPIVSLKLTDGSADTSFSPSGFTASGTGVRGISLQPDGKIVLAGYFIVNGNNRSLIRLNGNGSLDPTFAQVSTAQVGSSTLRALLPQPDGKLVVAASSVLRFDMDGTPDPTFSVTTLLDGIGFNTVSSATAYWMTPAEGGKFYVAGAFTMQNFTPGILRLNSDGTRDTTFNPPRFASESYQVNLARRSDGDYWAWGYFDMVDDEPRRGLVHLAANGTIKDTPLPPYAPGYIDAVTSAVVQSNDSLVFASLDYDEAAGAGFSYARRMTAQGAYDIDFLPTADLPTSQHFWAQPDGKLIIIDDSPTWAAAHGTPAHLQRIRPDGRPDDSFVSYASSFGGLTTGLVDVQFSGDQISSLTGGTVTILTQLQSGRLLLAMPTPSSNWRLVTIGPDGDGAVFWGGEFDGGGSSVATPSVRNPTQGYVEQPIVSSPAFVGPECALELPDGRVLISGQFTRHTDLAGDSHPAPGLVSLTGTGTFDPTFDLGSGPGLAGIGNPIPAVDRIVKDAQGRFWLAGEFDSFNGQPVPGVARLKADGSPDSSLNLDVGLGSYYTWAQIRHDLQFTPDGALYLVGQYLRPGEVWPYAITKLVVTDSPAPGLTAARADGHLVLTWSSSTTDYALETSPDLGSGATWKPVTGITTQNGDNFLCRTDPTEAHAFYRLRKL